MANEPDKDMANEPDKDMATEPNKDTASEPNQDVKRWNHSVYESIISVDSPYYLKTCSISIVPERLKECNEDAYMPKVVSIGPRFRGTREDLLLMEKIKLQCMSSLLHRSNDMQAQDYFEKCSDVILELDEKVRACYVNVIKLTKYELANIMLVDGCFLLELLISNDLKLNHELKSSSKYPSPGPEVVKDEEVLSDLLLLENQIPLRILHKLTQILFPNEFTKDHVQRVTRINDLALSLFGYTHFGNPGAPHFIELVHSSINKEAIKIEDGQEVVKIEETQQYLSHVVKSHVEVKLKCCATRLKAAGVTITLPDRDRRLVNLQGNCFGRMLIRLGNMLVNREANMLETVEMTKFDFDIKFNNGKLEIPQLHITGTTQAKWRNFIALEHHKKKWKSTAAYDYSGKCTWSALFFDGLICCGADVQLLKDKNIIVDHLKMSNKKLDNYFGTISRGVDHEIVDSSYIKIFNDLNNYSRANFFIRICKIWWHDFRFRAEQFVEFMGSGYNFAAILLSLLAIPQTIYAILPYYRPSHAH
ncbi:UPF0481 protein At3g47200-like [Gastrolobium bilobum]|uniref:UPF0481 protein At3g47200-like n=1 Tax=Gastrolobium bilobum TaxID=150636 RepID=UPI002AB09412|nr:UPF0481 protein At3g47200-like [Gastrolobium bilobum]